MNLRCVSLQAFKTFGDYLETLNENAPEEELRGLNAHDKEFWPRLKDQTDPEKMARVLRKYSKPLVYKFGLEIKEFFDQYTERPIVKPVTHPHTKEVMMTVTNLPKDKFEQFVAINKEHGLIFDGTNKCWTVTRNKLLKFDFPQYCVQMYNIGVSVSAFPAVKYNPQIKTEIKKSLPPTSDLPYRSVKISRLQDGRFEFRWNPYHPKLNDLFSNKTGMLTQISEYNPLTRGRETFSIELVFEALEKIKGIVPEWQIIFPDQEKITKEYEDFKARTQQQIPEVMKYLDPQFALFPFQNEGVLFFDKTNGNALLGDEMGLGKSLQTLSWVVMRGLRAFVVCPKTVRRNWINEAKRFFPNYFTSAIELTSNHKGVPLHSYKIASINYESLGKVADMVRAGGFDVLILDESQKLINTKTVTYQNVDAVKDVFKHKILLSGTAVKNKKHELFAQVELIQPGLFASKSELKMMTIGSAWNKIQSIYLQRSKAQVMRQMPPKITQVIEIPVDAPDYDPLAGLKFEDIGRLKAEVAVAKTKATIEFVKELLDESNSSMVVFSDSLEAAEKIYNALGSSVAMLHHGGLSDNVREKIKEDFQKGHTGHRVLVSTRQSLETGANLNRADKVIFNDLPWTASAVMQAEARCHRIGSTGTVNVFWITVSDNHFDTKVSETVKKKYELCKKMNEGKQLTAEERLWMEQKVSIEDFKRK